MAVRTIATDLVLSGEKEFNAGMKAVNSNLKTLKSDMAAVSAEFDDNANSVEALTAKQKVLQDTVEQQRVKVEALRAMYEKVKDTYGENSAQADKYKQQLNFATAALSKQTAEVEKNADAIKTAMLAENEFAEKMGTLDTRIQMIKSDMEASNAVLSEYGNSVESLTSNQKFLEEIIEQQRSKLASLREMYEKVSKAYGENSSQAAKYKQQVNNATIELVKQTSELKKNAAALEEVKAASSKYTTIFQRIATAIKKPFQALSEFKSKVSDTARNTPILAEALEAAGAGAKGLKLAATGAKTAVSALGTAAGVAAKGVGTSVTGIAKGVTAITKVAATAGAALAAAGVAGMVLLSDQVRSTVEAVQAAKEAHKPLSDSQKQWLEFGTQLETLDASVSNAKSALLGTLLPALGELSTEGAQFLDDFARDMEAAGGDTAKQSQVISDYIVKGATMIKAKLPEYVQLGKELFSGLADGISEVGPDLLDTGLDLMLNLMDGIIDNAPQLAEVAVTLIGQLIGGLLERGPDIVTTAMGMVTNIVQGMAQAAPDMIPAAIELVTQLLTALISAAPDLLMAGLELIYGIVSGINDNLGEIFNAADGIIQTIKDSFSEKIDDFLSIGENIVRGIWNGVSSATDWIYDKISGWVSDVVQWIKDKLEIGSPSRVMADEVGFWMARGVGSGFEKEMQKVNKAIGNSINTSFDIPEFAINSPRVYRGRNYTTSSGKVVNLYFYAKTITEADINMVVDIVNRKLGDDL